MREAERARIAGTLERYSREVRRLPGIENQKALETLSLQIVASVRREDYYRIIQGKEISARRADPNDPSFDAERAVAYYVQRGEIEEAAWLIFLMTHFARPSDTGWLRLRDVYGKLGRGRWTWSAVKADQAAFAAWLAGNWSQIRGKFGNHRKYESLRPNSARNMGRVVESYVRWIGPEGHVQFFRGTVREVGNDPAKIFDALYRKMRVISFGRLAKFDYLSLIGRYGVAPIRAGSAYLRGATGPKRGARLLIDGRTNGASSEEALQRILSDLDAHLNVGMDVMEDAICNWQKSPRKFVHFRG